MRIFHLIIVLVFFAAHVIANPASTTQEKYSWLSQYKSTNRAAIDPRFAPYIHSITPGYHSDLGFGLGNSALLSSQFLEALHGPPDDIRVLHDRYLVLSACQGHDCPNKGFLWIDTQSNVVVGSIIHYALDGSYEREPALLIFSTEVSCSEIPLAFMKDVDEWVRSQVGSVAKKRFVNLEGTLDESCLMAPRP
jgi:hypothetical protein